MDYGLQSDAASSATRHWSSRQLCVGEKFEKQIEADIILNHVSKDWEIGLEIACHSL